MLGVITNVVPLASPRDFNVTATNLNGSGSVQLVLTDNDSVQSAAGEPLGGFGNDGSTTSTAAIVDHVAPVSHPVAAAGTLGIPAPHIFYILTQPTDPLSGPRGVEVFWRKGNSGAFTPLPGGPFTAGYVPFDTSQTGGGDYEFYTVAIDRAGN